MQTKIEFNSADDNPENRKRMTRTLQSAINGLTEDRANMIVDFIIKGSHVMSMPLTAYRVLEKNRLFKLEVLPGRAAQQRQKTKSLGWQVRFLENSAWSEWKMVDPANLEMVKMIAVGHEQMELRELLTWA